MRFPWAEVGLDSMGADECERCLLAAVGISILKDKKYTWQLVYTGV